MAAPSDNLSDRILNLIDVASATFIVDTFNNLWAAITVSFRNLLILFIILYGLAIWRGLVKTPLQDIAWTALKFAIIFGLISTWALFNGIVVQFLTNTPDAMAGVIAGQTGTTASGAIGDVYIQAIGAADEVMSQGGWFQPYILGGIILLTATLMVVYSIFLIALAKIALAVLIGLGPLFLIFMMFKQTQKIFEAWLQQVINYIFVVVLTVAALGLMAQIAGNAVSLIPDTGITLGDIAPAAIVFLVVFLLLTQVQSIASALAGGIAISTQYVGAIVAHKAAGLVGRGANAAGRSSWSGTKAGATKAFSTVRNRFSRGTITPK